MHKIYLILRNNQQTGPYSIEELAEQRLQKDDLIWVEGKSAGWRFPSEVDALKHLVPDAAATLPISAPTAIHTITAPNTPEKNTSQPFSKPKNMYVSLPGAAPANASPADLTPEQKLEEKALALQAKVQAYMQQKETGTELTTQYARSLDDMKQQYTAWLQGQQKEKKQWHGKKPLVLAFFTLALALAGFTLTLWFLNKKNATPATELATGALLPESNAGQAFTGSTLQQKPEVLQQQPALFVTPITSSAETVDPDVKEESGKTFKNPFIQNATAGHKTTTRKNGRPKTPVAQQTLHATDSNTALAAAPPNYIEHKDNRIIPLSTQLALTSEKVFDKKGKYLDALQITLHNNSPETLQAVAVEVVYYKKEDQKGNRETLYFYHVMPHTAAALIATVQKKATTARLQLGAITRADGSLYYVQ